MLNRSFLFLLIAMLALTVCALAADATGQWTGQYETPRGAREVTFDLKAAGDQLTGKVITDRGDSEIQDGKVSGDEISFVRVLALQDREIRLSHTGKVSADEIKFTITMEDRDPIEFVVKRVK